MNEIENEILFLIRDPNKKEKGFKLLIETYQRQLYGMIRRMVIIHEDADDILQNTFIKSFKYIHQFEGNSALSTWLYRIAYNESLNFLEWKKKKQFFRIEDYQSQMLNLLSDQQLDEEKIIKVLEKSIAQLPPKQRLVFNLKYFEDLSYEEMKNITGTSIGALKASYHQAIKKIKDSIEED
jgi:RNA polymerase sigma factor (sigma-70 family)